MSNAGNNYHYLKYYLKLLELKEEDNLLYQKRKQKFEIK